MMTGNQSSEIPPNPLAMTPSEAREMMRQLWEGMGPAASSSPATNCKLRPGTA